MYGCAVDPSTILEIAREHGIHFIDDAAQAMGAKVKNKTVGSFGDAGLITFNKFLDFYFGGVVITNNEEIAAQTRILREQYEHRSSAAIIGYRTAKGLDINSHKAMKMVFWGNNHLHRLANITLAKKHFKEINGFFTPSKQVFDSWNSDTLTSKMIWQLMTYGGRCWHDRAMEQLELSLLKYELQNIDEHLRKRRALAKLYDETLDEDSLFKPKLSPNVIQSHLKYPILIPDKKKHSNCMTELKREGFMINYCYKTLHSSPFFNLADNVNSASFKEATYVSEHVLPLPIETNMSDQTIEKVVSIVNANLHN